MTFVPTKLLLTFGKKVGRKTQELKTLNGRPAAILILALRKRNFNRAGTETRPYPPKITDNRQIFTVFVGATLRGCP
jgi:hypothetical protein